MSLRCPQEIRPPRAKVLPTQPTVHCLPLIRQHVEGIGHRRECRADEAVRWTEARDQRSQEEGKVVGVKIIINCILLGEQDNQFISHSGNNADGHLLDLMV